MNVFCLAPGLALAVAIAGPVAAAETATDWLKGPTPEDLMTVWPREALKKGFGGRATIACQVSLQGALRDCSVESETPAGSGFGAAAIALTPQFLMKPATRDGQPVVSAVLIPVIFPTPEIATGTLLRGTGLYTNFARANLSNVPWTAAPTYAEVAAAYPEKARARQVGGRATLSCSFKVEGRVGSCQAVAEEPKGLGFGNAARLLAKSFVGPSTMDDGRSTVGMGTQIPFTFSADMLLPDKRVTGKLEWRAMPSVVDVAKAYPAAAMQAKVQGARVVMLCEVGVDGRLTGCSIESEEPKGFGFDQVALGLAGSFQLSIWSPEGLPTIGAKIRLPVRYQAPAPAGASQ